MKDHLHEFSSIAIKASPPVTVGASIMAGIQLTDIVLIATLIYTVLQIFILVRNLWREKYGTKPKGSPREAAHGSSEGPPGSD